MLTLFQLADSSFPTGAFAHSAGMESWCAVLGRDGGDIETALGWALRQSLCFSWPLALAVLGEPTQHCAQDALAEAALCNHVANRASRRQGRALLAAIEAAFAIPGLVPVADACRAKSLHGHVAPLWGLVGWHMRVSADDCGRVLGWTTARDLVSAVVRMNRIGPMAGQGMLARLAKQVPELLHQAAKEPGPTQAHPLLDVVQGMHDRLYSRLFAS